MEVGRRWYYGYVALHNGPAAPSRSLQVHLVRIPLMEHFNIAGGIAGFVGNPGGEFDVLFDS